MSDPYAVPGPGEPARTPSYAVIPADQPGGSLAAPAPAAALVPAGSTDARRWAAAGLAVAVVVLLGLLMGLAWYGIAPMARTQIIDGSVYLNGHDELAAAQDGWFAILAGVAGAVLAIGWPVLTRRTPVLGVLTGLLGSVALALVAWRVGTALGPAPLLTQVRQGVKAPITPLALNTPVAVLVAPMVFAAVRLVLELATATLGARGSAHLAHLPPPSLPAVPPLPSAQPSSPALPGSEAQAVDVQQGQ